MINPKVEPVFKSTDNRMFNTPEEASEWQDTLDTCEKIHSLLFISEEVTLEQKNCKDVAEALTQTDLGLEIYNLLHKLYVG